MHILFLCDHLGYRDGAWHGCTTYFLNVLPQLQRAGHRVSLCVLRGEHRAADMLRAAGVSVECLDAMPTSLWTVWRLARKIIRERVDVVHATQRESTGHARVFGFFSRRLRVVMHIVDSDPVPWLERIANRMLPQPDLALCVSGAVRAAGIEAYGVDPCRLRVLHNAIDLGKLKPSSADARERIRASLSISADAPVVVSTSRFTWEKRMTALIDMIPAVLESEPRTVFLLAGSGPELELCRDRAEALGVSAAVRFLGHRSDVPDLLAASDVAVMLCEREAFGYSAVEAMASTVPVVAYGGSGLSEVVSAERNGLLVPPGNDAAFKSHLVRLIRDTGLRTRLGANAREDVRRFDIGMHVQDLARLYVQLLAPVLTGGAVL